VNANQLVAYNLRRAREERGWTQEQAAVALEERLGLRWSKASFSVAERSGDDDATRKREFDADELVAIAAVFQKPVAWFFTMPEDVEQIYCGDPLDVRRPVTRLELEDLTPQGDLTNREAAERLEEIANELRRGDPTARRKTRRKRIGQDKTR
jgi:transcriptional regulator with XRE-family HTH domain